MAAPAPTDRSPGAARSRIYLHIGAMKTGTTFLQHFLEANRRRLGEHGHLVPRQQGRALRSLLSPDPERRRRPGRRLIREIRGHRGPTILVSWEFLGFADRTAAERLLTALSADAEVHVVITARDASGTLPAQWQTRCRNGGRVRWRGFLRGIDSALDGGRRREAARVFLRGQGIPRMLDVWVPLVGAERVHLVTVPPRGSDPMLLWRRFAEAVGIEHEAGAEVDVARNPSLGWSSSELLRRINVALGPVHPMSSYHRVVRAVVARALETRAGSETRVPVTEESRALAARWNDLVREAVLQHGVRVVGDLGDLPVDITPHDGPPAPAQAPESEMLAAAGVARDALLDLIDHVSDQVSEEVAATLPTKPVDDRRGPTTAARWSDAADPVAEAVTELTTLVKYCLDLDRAGARPTAIRGRRAAAEPC